MKTVLSNNTTTMRKHCKQFAKTHFQIYKDGCEKASIKMHLRAVPKKELENVAVFVLLLALGHLLTQT